jgi:aspartyl-tRNA(Asn)/glutamyl-tRNA(Gln) amidotransferase subunit A
LTLAWHGLTQLKELLDRGELSSLELTESLLARINRADGKLHAFVDVYAEEARALARAADQARAARLPLGPLHGLPIVLKDLLDIEGRICTLGSKHYVSRIATETSATVERLLAAGMVPLGKVHMTEFAFGGWGTNPLMGTPQNPWDLDVHRVPGGSSSGTAVAVAAGFAPVGIGSDTGGSVRIPSAFNGLTGLKVTFGRISLHATGLLSWTLDSIGPLGRCVRDCALILDALAAPDPRDPTTLSQPLEQFARQPQAVRGMRVALPDSKQLPSFMDPGITAAWQSAARVFESLGAQVITTRMPSWYFDLSVPAGCIIASEAYALHRDYVNDESAQLGPAVRNRILAAEKFGPGDYAQTLHTMAQRRREFAGWFEDYDAILLPTIAIPAIPVEQVDETSPIPGYLTRPGNYLGLCALSQPAGLVGGLPASIQIIGKPWAERTVLALGQAFETATTFHSLRPKLSSLGLE